MLNFKSAELNDFVEKYRKLLSPENVVLIDGTKDQLDLLYEKACKSGELIKLNQEKECSYARN